MKPYHPSRGPSPIARQAECVGFVARENWESYRGYLHQFSDVTAFVMKGWPEPLKWLDLAPVLDDAAASLRLLAELAQLRGEERVLRELREAVERETAAGAR